jgi:outer membrane biosynthesis protein TonB
VTAEIEMEMELQVPEDIPPPEMVASVEEVPEPEIETTESQPEVEEVAPKIEEPSNEKPVEEETETVEEATEETPVETEETEQEEVKQEETKEPVKEPSAKEKAATKIVKKIDDKARYDDAAQIKTLIVMQILGDTKSFFDTQSIIQDNNINEYLDKSLEDQFGVLFQTAQNQTMEDLINGQY